MEQKDRGNSSQPATTDEDSARVNRQTVARRRAANRRTRRINLASPYTPDNSSSLNRVSSTDVILPTTERNIDDSDQLRMRRPRRVVTTVTRQISSFPAGTDFDRMDFFSQTIERQEYLATIDPLGLDTLNLPASESSKGLTGERIEKFESFSADESLKGEHCIVCGDEIEVGRRMVRLDCHVSHILCKKCAEKWFKDHNTCTNCRKEFS